MHKNDDGFSSEDQLKEEQIFINNRRTLESRIKIRQESKFIIPPASQIRDKAKVYSLHPDIITGWVPKMILPNPIPLLYQNAVSNIIIKQLMKPNNTNGCYIRYLGPKHQNSYNAHLGKPYPFPYNHIKKPENIKSTRPFTGNNPKVLGPNFDSCFESGNLDMAIKVGEYEYDLMLQVDSNTRGHMQWYYFKISEAVPSVKYRFHICNFVKAKSLYSRGMKPYIYSSKKFVNFKIGWEQCGQNLRYQQKALRYKFLNDYEIDTSNYYRLSFEYIFEYQKDEVQFAYCVPYQYSYLMQFLSELKQKQLGNFMSLQKLTTSLGGLDIPLITIHEPDFQTNHHIKFHEKDEKNDQQTQKKCIVISGRAHPGESNGSYMLHGFLDFLCGYSPIAVYLRKRIVFKIVPMLNPDGVVIGNYRTGLSGKDFNRQFLRPDKSIFPQICAMKDLVIKCKRQFKKNFLMFLDFHGHSVKKNVFMYGPEFPITQKNYYQTKVFPKLLGKKNFMFRYYSCIFKVSSFKETTARAILLKKLDIPYSYTIQASNGSYYDRQQMKDVPFNARLWIEMGQSIGLTLYEYCLGVFTAEEIKRLKKKKSTTAGNIPHKKRTINEQSRLSHNRVAVTAKNLKNILSGSQQDKLLNHNKFRKIIEQIKQEQKNPQEMNVSDDGLSEGSSDQEKEDQDLSPQKMNELHQLIKYKKNNEDVQDCKLQSQQENQSLQKSIKVQEKEDQSQLPPLGNQVFITRINPTKEQNLTSITNTKPIAIQAIKESLKYKSNVRVSNISFYHPYQLQNPSKFSEKIAQKIGQKLLRKNQQKPTRLKSIVQNLNRTYVVLKDTTSSTKTDKDQIQKYMHNLTFYQLQRISRGEETRIKISCGRKQSLNYSTLYLNK